MLVVMTILMMVATTSCLDGDNNDKMTVQVKYDRVFSSIRDNMTGKTFNSPETVYTIELNYTDQTMKIVVNNLRLSATDNPRTFTIDGIKLKSVSPDGALTAEATSLNPDADIHISNLKVSLQDRVIDQIYRPVFAISYTLNSDLSVTVIPNTCYYYGTLTSVSETSGATFTKNNLPVEVTFNLAENTASMRLKGVKFVEAMPRELDMTFPGIDFVTDIDGYTLSASSLIPEIGKDEYPGYPITGLSANAKMAGGKMTSSFTCTPERLGAYTVSLNLSPFQQK